MIIDGIIRRGYIHAGILSIYVLLIYPAASSSAVTSRCTYASFS